MNTAWMALVAGWLAGFAAPPGATVTLRITEEHAGRRVPAPARVHLSGPDGKAVQVPGLPFFRDHFNCDGEARIEGLAPGHYPCVIERGPEYRRVDASFDLQGEGPRTIDVELKRRINMAERGWYSGDIHIHRPLEDMPLLMKSEDLNVAPVITVWNKRDLWAGRPLPEDRLVEVEPTRWFHVMAIEDERRGGALLYFQLKNPLKLAADGPEFPSPVKHLNEARAQPGAWIDIEKPFWWDMPTWVATEQTDSIEIAHNQMNRAKVYPNEAWGRPRDEARFPSPRGNGLYSQEIYYHLLNCGLRLPPSAGSASGVLPNPVGHCRAYVHIDGPFSYDAWWRGLKAGRSFVTNGPILLVQANGKDPGTVFKSEKPLALNLAIQVDGNDPIDAVEVIRDGEVVERFEGKGTKAEHQSRPLVFERGGWFLVRVICHHPESFRFASTAPFHVEAGAEPVTIHKADVAYFIDWIDERIAALSKPDLKDLADPDRREAVLKPHREARRFFEERLRRAR